MKKNCETQELTVTTHNPYYPSLLEKSMYPSSSCLEEVPTCEQQPDFHFNVYNWDCTHFYRVSSENVVPTVGSLKYMHRHLQLAGPGTQRMRFQVCHNYLSGTCDRGSSCTYIHAIALQPPSVVHRYKANDDTSSDVLPPGCVIYVYPPGSNGTVEPQGIRSEHILRTQGAIAVYTAMVNNTTCGLNKPKHCSHFQMKRICNRGAACNFIHSLVPLPGRATHAPQAKAE